MKICAQFWSGFAGMANPDQKNVYFPLYTVVFDWCQSSEAGFVNFFGCGSYMSEACSLHHRKLWHKIIFAALATWPRAAVKEQQRGLVDLCSFFVLLILKRVWHEIFDFRFLSWIIFLRPLSIPWSSFRIFKKKFSEIFESKGEITGVNDTSDKWEKFYIGSFFIFC